MAGNAADASGASCAPTLAAAQHYSSSQRHVRAITACASSDGCAASCQTCGQHLWQNNCLQAHCAEHKFRFGLFAPGLLSLPQWQGPQILQSIFPDQECVALRICHSQNQQCNIQVARTRTCLMCHRSALGARPRFQQPHDSHHQWAHYS